MSKTILVARVNESGVSWDSPQLAKNTLSQFVGKRIAVTIEPFKKKRSYLQNAYWWGVVIEIIYATYRGFGEQLSRNDCHEMMKGRFLQASLVHPDTGEILETYTKSTASLSTAEFMELIQDVQQYFAEQFGVVIPDPNQELIKKD